MNLSISSIGGGFSRPGIQRFYCIQIFHIPLHSGLPEPPSHIKIRGDGLFRCQVLSGRQIISPGGQGVVGGVSVKKAFCNPWWPCCRFYKHHVTACDCEQRFGLLLLCSAPVRTALSPLPLAVSPSVFSVSFFFFFTARLGAAVCHSGVFTHQLDSLRAKLFPSISLSLSLSLSIPLSLVF